MMTTTDNDMRVWVGCLACYNDGRLVGSWVDATRAADSAGDPDWCIGVHGPELAAGEPVADHEEWWVFDTDGLPGLGECSPDEAQRYAETVAACAEGTGAPVAAVFAYLENFHGSAGDMSALDSFEDAYCGEWESRGEYAEDLVEQCGYVSQIEDSPLSPYIDWDAWTRDLFLSDYWAAPAPRGGVFVFRHV